jgi:hypothetical protein
MKINYKTNKINNGVLNLEKPFVGEGIVWTGFHEEHKYIFKVKGEKHSVSKVKTLASVDVEKMNSINEFVSYAVTENRLKQAVTEVSGQPDVKRLGDIIRWVYSDVIKEEIDTIVSNSLSEKELGKPIADATRKLYFKLYA